MRHTRWRITGTLKTTAPLHIGCGDVVTFEHPLLKDKDDELNDIQAIVVDVKRKPCIPGPALKGVLRSWAEQMLLPKDDEGRVLAGYEEYEAPVTRIFGSRDIEQTRVESGWAEFCTAFVKEPSPADQQRFGQHLPYWNVERLTGTLSHVAMDRETGTAAHNKLFYEEFVPEGVAFDVEIDATRLTEKEISLLLAILKQGATHGTHPYHFGANGANGWGRMQWELGKVECCTETPKSVTTVGFACCTSDKTNAVIPDNLTLHDPPHIAFDLMLGVNGPFLVNDASRAKEKGSEATDKTNFTPLRNAAGEVWLPASSLRGVLRERAEFILRSLDPNATGDPNQPAGEGPIERIFGKTSQSACLTISEPTQCEESADRKQDFVAIDRFTGGAADGAKFDATYADSPKFETHLVLEVATLKPEDLALLRLAIRDLCTGQTTLGFGGAKGYGEAIGTVSNEQHHGVEKRWNVPIDLIGNPLAADWLYDQVKRNLLQQAVLNEKDLGNTGQLTSSQVRGNNNAIEWEYKISWNQCDVPSTAQVITSALVPQEFRNRLIRTPVNVSIKMQDGQVVAVHSIIEVTAQEAQARPSNRLSPQQHNQFAHTYYFARMIERDQFSDGLKGRDHRRWQPGLYSGNLKVKLTVKTPLLICDDEKREPDPEIDDHFVYPVRTDSQGKPLLASSSVRGMLRSAHEAITNSRFGVFPPTHSRPLSFRPGGTYRGRKLYDKSPLDLLPEALRPAASLDELSPADRVFGWVNQDEKKAQGEARAAYRSHLRVSSVTCATSAEEAIQEFETPKTLAILGQPKPQQGRFYLGDKEGKAQQAGRSKEQSGYTEGNRIRGPKVYPHHKSAEAYTDADQWQAANRQAFSNEKSNQNRSITGWVRPGTEFSFDLHVTNLSDVELGALVWLLSLPDEHYLRLGLGKPLGFGSVRVEIDTEKSMVADGATWIQQLTDTSQAFPPTKLEDLQSQFQAASNGANPDLLNAFLRAASGFGNAPIHYPITANQKPGDGATFKWFVENEKQGKQMSLPDLNSPNPYLPKH